jgi:small subunit ribosomal protein S6
MPLYEHIFMVRQDASNAQVDGLTQHFKSVIEGGGGKIGKTEYWGVKTLTYRIRKNRKAHYTLMNLDAPPAAVKEMERQMSINEDVIRFITLKVDELEEGPSAMLRFSRSRDDRGERRDRDDRGDRGDRPDRFAREDRGPRADRDDRASRSGPRRERSGEAEGEERA